MPSTLRRRVGLKLHRCMNFTCAECGNLYPRMRMTQIEGKWVCWPSCWGNEQLAAKDALVANWKIERDFDRPTLMGNVWD